MKSYDSMSLEPLVSLRSQPYLTVQKRLDCVYQTNKWFTQVGGPQRVLKTGNSWRHGSLRALKLSGFVSRACVCVCVLGVGCFRRTWCDFIETECVVNVSMCVWGGGWAGHSLGFQNQTRPQRKFLSLLLSLTPYASLFLSFPHCLSLSRCFLLSFLLLSHSLHLCLSHSLSLFLLVSLYHSLSIPFQSCRNTSSRCLFPNWSKISLNQ